MPEYVRAAVDWPRLHGTVATIEVETPDVSLSLPVRIAVEPQGALVRPTVHCGFQHDGGIRDWVYEDGVLHPIMRLTEHNPEFRILPPRVVEEIQVVHQPGRSLAVCAPKGWPDDMTGEANGRELDWPETTATLAGCAVVLDVDVWIPVAPGGRPSSRMVTVQSAPFVLKRAGQTEGWFEIEGEGGEYAALHGAAEGARLFSHPAETYIHLDGIQATIHQARG